MKHLQIDNTAVAPAVIAKTPKFSFGMEEEFFLVDASTGTLARSVPEKVFDIAGLATEGAANREFLRSQIELVTPPLTSASDALRELSYGRKVLSQLAKSHDLGLIASGTHPTAHWRGSVQSPGRRYDKVMSDLQMVGRRNMLCGMHVHVEVPDPDLRVQLMGMVVPYIPLFIALSTSSPFWQGEGTGLKGYRLAAYDELPRTGLPELFETKNAYDAYVAALVSSGIMPDDSYIWWAIRPSKKYPTLELRAPDACTSVKDSVAIASLYRALVRRLCRSPSGARPDPVVRAVAVENKWRAQRYGAQAVFASLDGPVTMAEWLEETLAFAQDDFSDLDCSDQMQRCREIVVRGTSADLQLRTFESARKVHGEEAAFSAVLQDLTARTIDWT